MFDGVHLGHRAVLNLAVEEAGRENDLVAALYVPRTSGQISEAGQGTTLIMDPRAKSAALLSCGLDCVVMKPFDESLVRDFLQGIPGYLKDQIPNLRRGLRGREFSIWKGPTRGRGLFKKNGALVGLRFALPRVCSREIAPLAVRESGSPWPWGRSNRPIGCSAFLPRRGTGGSGEQVGAVDWISYPQPSLASRGPAGLWGLSGRGILSGKKRVRPWGRQLRSSPDRRAGEAVEPLFEVHLMGEGDHSVHQPGDSISINLLKFIRLRKNSILWKHSNRRLPATKPRPGNSRPDSSSFLSRILLLGWLGFPNHGAGLVVQNENGEAVHAVQLSGVQGSVVEFPAKSV